MKRRWAVAVMALSLGLPCFLYAREFLVVDGCLDHGGSFDYASGTCDFAINHQFVPFASRHGKLLASSVAGLMAGLALLMKRPKAA
jgi:hypothetical protein